jgi:NTP pyrophosphatase (non-canonical NTP hydrolase)
MKLNKEFEPIRDWAKEKGIYDKATIEMQMIKLVEEMGELANGIIKKNDDEVKDAIGDCVVVLTNLAEMYGCGSIEDCINSAYGVIANRTGKMIDGVFVKEI